VACASIAAILESLSWPRRAASDEPTNPPPDAPAHMELPGKLFVVAAPSGAGKSTLVKALLQHEPHLAVSVSHTTRAPRGQERDGVEYHFASVERFRQMVAAGEFFEHAHVHGNWYGTSRASVQTLLAAGKDVVLEIDWQGALQIRQLFPAALLVFILPPSWDALAQRLRGRGEDAPEVIAQRLANARHEVAQAERFDFVIINGSLDEALADLRAVACEQPQTLRFAAQRRNHPDVFAALNLA
jgi:guanylate kinase